MAIEYRKSGKWEYTVLTACPFCDESLETGVGSGKDRKEHLSQCSERWDYFESHSNFVGGNV